MVHIHLTAILAQAWERPGKSSAYFCVYLGDWDVCLGVGSNTFFFFFFFLCNGLLNDRVASVNILGSLLFRETLRCVSCDQVVLEWAVLRMKSTAVPDTRGYICFKASGKQRQEQWLFNCRVNLTMSTRALEPSPWVQGPMSAGICAREPELARCRLLGN